MKSTTIMPVLSFLTLSIYTSLGYSTELNTDFLQGISEVPSILKDGVQYPAGHYYVDVILNKSNMGRRVLNVTPEDEQKGKLCLSPEWLKSAGIFFKPTAYQDTFDKTRDCYMLGKKESTEVNFDLGNQTLSFSIPQAWLAEKNDATRWDYGVNGLRLIYSGNFNKNVQIRNKDDRHDDALTAYGSIDANLNLGRWVLSSNINANRNASGSNVNTNNIVLSTAISQVKGDLLLGRSQTRSELFTDFGFYGAALRSNSNMRTWGKRGYAPVITGVASTTSRLTITQGGYTVYSAVVPPGPYQISDISPVGNGNLFVTLEDNSGRKTVTEYPVATLPSLLRAGELNYNLALGQRNDSNKINDAFSSGLGTFGLMSLDYGLKHVTLNSAAILHNRYQATGVGITLPMGNWGVLSTSVNASRAEYDHEEDRQGISTTLKYAKNFTNRTDLQLLTYRYQSPGYTEFAKWYPDQRHVRSAYSFDGKGGEYRYTYFSGKEKARYEARLSHRLDSVYLSGTFWQQSYWDSDRDAIGTTLAASTSLSNGISLNINGNYSRNAWSSRDDYAMSLSMSIPFNIGKQRYYSNNSLSYTRGMGTSVTTSASATVNDRLNYTVNAGAGSKNNTSAGVNASYAFDRIQTNAGLNQDRNTTTLSGNFSGSAIATPETGLLFTKEAAETIAIVKIKDMPGVTFNNSLPTNNRGITALYLTGYNPSSITINPENVPDNTELLNTSYEVVPTEKALIYREFGFQNVLRYIVRLRDAQGTVLSGGNASTEQGLDAGFVAGNGVLLMNLLAAPKKITVSLSNGKSCSFNAGLLNANTGKIQEVRCE